ncbi:MAG: hypothetical protein E7I43_05875 [Actinomyces sp.]|nr:hypothetical protein [Actinomyces sp.]
MAFVSTNSITQGEHVGLLSPPASRTRRRDRVRLYLI